MSKNARRFLIELANSAMIVIEKDGDYGEASIEDLGLRMRFADIHRKYKRLFYSVWEGNSSHSFDMTDREFKTMLDDFQDLGNYSYLAIPVFRCEAGRKYKKSEYKEAAEFFMGIAAVLDPSVTSSSVDTEPGPELEPEDKLAPESKKKTKRALKADKKAQVARTLRLLDGDDIAEVAFDAQAKVDGLTPEAGKLLMLSWAKSTNLGKGDKTTIPLAAQLKPKFIANLVAKNESVMADVMKQCDLKTTGETKELVEQFFQFALVHLDIIEGPKVDDPKEMVKTAKKDPEVIGVTGDDEAVVPVND